MSKYQEMSETALKRREKEIQYRERCHNCLLAFLKGFIRYCEIPREQVQCLRWNKQDGDASEFSAPIAGTGLAPPDAIEFDEQTRDFVLGIRVLLGDQRVLPRPWVFFPVYVHSKENDYLTLRLGGSGKRHRIDFVVNEGWVNIYEEAIQGIKDALLNPRRPANQKIGFSSGEINQ